MFGCSVRLGVGAQQLPALFDVGSLSNRVNLGSLDTGHCKRPPEFWKHLRIGSKWSVSPSPSQLHDMAGGSLSTAVSSHMCQAANLHEMQCMWYESAATGPQTGTLGGAGWVLGVRRRECSALGGTARTRLGDARLRPDQIRRYPLPETMMEVTHGPA